MAGAQAEVRYVSDRLEIQMRSGKSLQHRILRMLPSGTRLEVLETDAEAGWSRVRTPGGKEGWVLTRFLMDNAAARDQLASAQKKLAELEVENGTLKAALDELRNAKGSVEKERTELGRESQRLAQELEEIRRTASSALAIDAENKKLKTQMVAVQREIETLQQENDSLRDRTARDWFMVGAGVIILGILIGLIIPRLRFRRRSSWGEL
jgi:SH3 domain protein